jgi:hypothetical protein
MIRAIPTAGFEDTRVDTYWIWVIAGIALVVAELLSGTFYLLVLGVAAFVAAAVAWFGAAAVRAVGEAISAPGGQTAANLKAAELYVQQFGHLAKTNNTMIVPSNLSDVASVVASAMTVLERTKAGAQQS